jgi:Aspartyl protease
VDRLRLPVLGVAAIFVTVAALPVRARCHIGNVVAIPVAIDNNQLLAQGAIDGHSVRVLIDTGSNMSLIWRSAAQRLGLRLIGAPRKRLFGLGGESRIHYVSAGAELVGIGSRSLQSWIADVQSFRLGDESINSTQLSVAQLGKYQTMGRIGSRIPVAAVPEPGMLLGMDFLRSHRIVVDNATRKMVFTYEGGPVFQIGN